jgi:hypothetical protein
MAFCSLFRNDKRATPVNMFTSLSLPTQILALLSFLPSRIVKHSNSGFHTILL